MGPNNQIRIIGLIMLYVEKDADGKIISVSHTPTGSSTEQKSIMDKELINFLSNNVDSDPWLQRLVLSDMSTVRILEDLIDLLITKKIIMLTDLPPEAQVKIQERKLARQKINAQEFIVDDII